MPGRGADMSPAQAAAMRTALAQIEAGSKVVGNREYIVLDITNQGARGVCGAELSQPNMKRVDRKHQASVDAFVREVGGRLLGTVMSEPPAKEDVLVWADAAKFFAARIQTPYVDCPCPHEDRKADMSFAAGKELWTVVAQME